MIFECARTRVPLDYDHPRGRTISLNLIRIPATDPENRVGAILANPGGPGGSGVDFVLTFGPFVGPALGQEVAERFDFVGFDPRGVADSTPIRCFRTIDEAVASRPPIAFPLTGDEEALFEQADALLARNCASRFRNELIGSHMSTANVARDMDVIRERMGDEQLNFFGLSYGSFLGTTYANLFPDQVRSFVLDGIVDPDAYVNVEGAVPTFNRLRSDEGAQETLEKFFELCDAAAPGNCALAPNSRARYVAAADALLQSPLEIVDPDTGEVVLVVTYQDLIAGTWASLYFPDMYAALAASIAEFEALAANPISVGAAVDRLKAGFGAAKTSVAREPYDNIVEGQPGVLCVDSNHPTDYSAISEAGAAADETYGYFGRLWTWVSSECARWPFADRDRYVGPFDANTANPVLIVATLYDPATRYEGAQTLRSILPNSGLLSVDAPGHTAFLAGSACSIFIVGQYFLDPEVANLADGELCPAEFNPFDAFAVPRDEALSDMRQAVMAEIVNPAATMIMADDG
ncbi:MAG: alpha/beta hydrolase [Acidimicrobiia bacterium]|nr:alpha/beta hydrolase [Acidimicrobiia bacterium]